MDEAHRKRVKGKGRGAQLAEHAREWDAWVKLGKVSE